MRKSIRGFTIVELLIVIVIIGILAAIVIVSFNGITTRAKNSQTLSAVDSWVKALRLYETDNGSLPFLNSCFGKTTTYSGTGQCWDSSTWKVNQPFLTAMSPYINSANAPEPDTSQTHSTTFPDRRGAFYYGTSGSTHYIYVMLVGVSTCPTVASATYANKSTGSEGIACIYALD